MANSVAQRLFVYVELLSRRSNLLSYFIGCLVRVLNCVCTVEVFLFRGVLRGTDRLSNGIFIGEKESAYQFANTACSKILWMTTLGRLRAFRVDPSRLPKVEVTATAACLEKPLVTRFLRNNFLTLPLIDFNLDLSKPMSDITKRLSRRRRRELIKLAGYNYSWKVSRDDEKDFDLFYWKMYYPYVTRRFGRAASISSCLVSKSCYLHKGGIMFVCREGKLVGGTLFQIRGKTLCALSLGVYEGSSEFHEDLVGQAALFFLIKWAKTNHIAGLNYGATLPFLKDGIFQYKKEWGMFVTRRKRSVYCLLRLDIQNKDAVSVLSQNPFIFVEKGLMKAVVFVEHAVTRTELEQISSKYLALKLDSVIVVACSDNRPSASKPNAPLIHHEFQNHLAKPLLSICMHVAKQGFEVNVFEFPGTLADLD